MRLKIATWNINSVRAHMASVERFLDGYKPHVLCLQETKVRDDLFPLAPFRKPMAERPAGDPRPLPYLDDPADPARTHRVLTLLFPSEY